MFCKTLCHILFSENAVTYLFSAFLKVIYEFKVYSIAIDILNKVKLIYTVFFNLRLLLTVPTCVYSSVEVLIGKAMEWA